MSGLRAKLPQLFMLAVVALLVFLGWMHSKALPEPIFDTQNVHPLISQPLKTTSKKKFTNESSPNDVTVVTMYLNLGRFQKGTGAKYHTTDTYREWMTTWGWLTNRVLAIFDDDLILEHFRQARSALPADRTIFKKVSRDDLPAFKNYAKISQIYANSSYPKHPPNTVNAGYSCAMNAKYDALQMALDMGLNKTKYIAWLDIGGFRNLLEPQLRPANDIFTLEVPGDFDDKAVGFTEVTPHDELRQDTPWIYIKYNRVWVAGTFVLATHPVMRQFIASYRSAAQDLVDHNMSSTDQQVIGAMYSPQMVSKQRVGIMSYRCKEGYLGIRGSFNQYFCFPHICKLAGQWRQETGRELLACSDPNFTCSKS